LNGKGKRPLGIGHNWPISSPEEQPPSQASNNNQSNPNEEEVHSFISGGGKSRREDPHIPRTIGGKIGFNYYWLPFPLAQYHIQSIHNPIPLLHSSPTTDFERPKKNGMKTFQRGHGN
jgi:hypothetical protein